MIEKIVTGINDALYSYVLVIILLAGGLYFSVRTGFCQFRLLGEQIRAVTERPGKKGGISSFQALMVSTASRVGTGNIVGVATALCLGGFGSVFWMWMIALVGGASAFVESTLAQIYKRKGADGSYGGPAYYIESAFRSRALAVVFCIFLILTYGVGFNMLTSYNLQSSFSSYGFYDKRFSPWIIGAILSVLVAFCLFGGGKRIINTTTFLVPFMGIAYILVALVVVCLNITHLPAVFARIFTEAFDIRAIFSGFSGSCVMYGIRRGLLSNEAGIGSAPNASASADVDHPAKQGLVQVLSVFIDTLLICTATAFMCMCSGVEPSPEFEGAAYVQAALSRSLGSFGPVFITVSMILFAFTTLIGNLYYVDKSLLYLLRREPSKRMRTAIYIVATLIILLGSVLNADLLWGIADITMGGMAVINMPVIIVLSKYAFGALADYTKKRKTKAPMTFKASDVGVKDKTDYWN